MEFIWFLIGWGFLAILIAIWDVWSDRKMEKMQK